MTLRLIAAALLLAAAARAEDRFGARGTIVPSGGFGYAHSSSNGSTTDSFFVAPEVIWFAADGLGLGLEAGIGHTSNSTSFGGLTVSSSSTTFSVAPALAGAVAIADRVTWFPQVSLSYVHASGDGPSASRTVLSPFLPVVFAPVPHFFLGAGPFLSWIVAGDGSGSTSFGLQSQIGGWF